MLIILFNNMFLYNIMYLIMFFQVNYLDISILFKVTNIYNGIKHTFFFIYIDAMVFFTAVSTFTSILLLI